MTVDVLCAFHEESVPRVFSDVFAVTSRNHGNKPVGPSSELPAVPNSRPVQPPLTPDLTSGRTIRRSAAVAGKPRAAGSYGFDTYASVRPTVTNSYLTPGATTGFFEPALVVGDPGRPPAHPRSLPLIPGSDPVSPPPGVRRGFPAAVATAVATPAVFTPAELEFHESAKRYTQRDWAHEKNSKPCRNAAIKLLSLGTPSPEPPAFLDYFPELTCPGISGVLYSV